MRFERLVMRRFGHFTDFTLDFGTAVSGKPDLHVLYGPNEAGKSTTLAAIGDILYGIKRQTPWSFLHTNDVLELEATLVQGSQRVDLKRFKNHWSNASNERLERFPLDLQGLSREDYTRRFSFDEQTLQAGGEQILNSAGDIGQALFSASAGLANLKEQIDAAMTEANAFWIPRRKRNLQLTELKKALQDNKQQMDAVRLDTRAWKRRRENLQHATLRRDKNRQQRDELQRSLRQLERHRSAAALAIHLRALVNQRDALAAEGVVSFTHARAADFLTGEAARQLLDRTRDQLEDCRVARRARSELESQLRELEQRLQASAPDERILRLVQEAARIRTLADESAAAYEWQQQLAQYQTTKSQCQAELAAARERLSLPEDCALETRLPGESLLAELQSMLDKEQMLAADLRHASQELDRLEPLPEDRTAGQSTALDRQLPDLDIAAELLRSVQQAGLSNQLTRAQEELLANRHAFAAALARTGLCQEQLSELYLPDRGWLNARLDELAQRKQQGVQLQERIGTLSSELRQISARCEELRLSGAMDPALLTAAVTTRDEAWSSLYEAIDAGQTQTELLHSARQFERSMHEYDSLQSRFASSTQASTELQLLQAQLRRQQHDLSELQDKQWPHWQQQLRVCVDQLSDAVAGFHQAGDIDPDALRDRHEKISQLLTRQEAMQADELILQKLALKATEQRRKLLAMLEPMQNPAQLEALARLELDDLLTQAGRILESHRAELAKRQEAERALQALFSEHESRREQFESASKNLEQWQLCWQAATTDTVFAGQTVACARDSLSWVAGLPPLVQRHREASQALETLSQRMATREGAVEELLKQIGEISLQEAVQHLNAASAQIQKHEALQAERESVQQKLQNIASVHQQSLQAVESLRNELGTESDQELLKLLIRSEQHRTLNDRCQETLFQLREISGEEPAEAEIESLSRDIDTDALEQQVAELNSQLAEASRIYDESSEAWALANRELEDIGDDSRYSHLNQERQNLVLQAMDLATQCVIARTGQKVLTAAMARFRQEHQSVILTEAQHAFTTLTGGRYVQLLPRDDGHGNERLFVIDQQQKARAVAELSTGTRYQLYLALRAAAHADYAAQRPPLPFVADDIMESFDDHRSAAAFKVLERMANRGQVIYLTHHQHLLDLARDELGEDHVRVHHFH